MDTPLIIRAFIMTFIAGMATGIGGLVAFFSRHTKTSFFSYSLGFSAGLMIYISFDELLPSAHRYGKYHTAIYGLLNGMIVIGVSLLLLS